MDGVGTLLAGVAAIITALGGAVAVVITAVRGSKKERGDAARAVVQRIEQGGGEDSKAEMREMLEELLKNRSESDD